MYGITWDYETNYYHIYAISGPLDGILDPITIDLEQTPENDADIQAITDTLRKIAARTPPDQKKRDIYSL
jgi:hypothetical protein